MHTIGAGVASLAHDPLPAGRFHAGEHHLLRVGGYRTVYIVEGDLVTVCRVDRVGMIASRSRQGATRA